jgi:nucleoside-diphosphate-sugar epimerase
MEGYLLKNNRKEKIACVTGASGMVGGSIARRLLELGYTVRVLSRKATIHLSGVDVFCGGLEDEQILRTFLDGASMLFHCAAEVRDESKMYAVNVLGTECILQLAEDNKIEYFCHISTCAVVGRTKLRSVNEHSPCQPDNIYEKTKWIAEQQVMQGLTDCKVVVLRPTQIVSADHPGVISLPGRARWIDHLKLLLKGAECAYVIHVEDVAAAAMHFIEYPINSPQSFFVSCDEHPLNTYAGVWGLYQARLSGKSLSDIQLPWHLPLFVPYVLRRLLRRNTKNRGDVHYSSDKLRMFGFMLPLGLVGAIDDVIRNKGASSQ